MSPLDFGHVTNTEFLTRPIPAPPRPSAGVPESWKAMSLRERRQLFERALDSLWLAFQPIVSLTHQDEPAFAFEALARNAEPQVRDPRDLLALAVSVDMVGDLGRIVHARAAEALR